MVIAISFRRPLAPMDQAESHTVSLFRSCLMVQPVKFNVAPKIPTAASASAHKAGGGNVVITDKVRRQ